MTHFSRYRYHPALLLLLGFDVFIVCNRSAVTAVSGFLGSSRPSLVDFLIHLIPLILYLSEFHILICKNRLYITKNCLPLKIEIAYCLWKALHVLKFSASKTRGDTNLYSTMCLFLLKNYLLLYRYPDLDISTQIMKILISKAKAHETLIPRFLACQRDSNPTSWFVVKAPPLFKRFTSLLMATGWLHLVLD